MTLAPNVGVQTSPAASPSAAAGNPRYERLDSYSDGANEVVRYRLDNGLEVIIWEDHTAPVFSYQTWFRVGSRHDPKGCSGISHLFEHLMFKATTTRAEGEYDRIMEARGGQTNAATWVDWTYYKAKLPRWELDLVIELEADRMEHLALSSDMLEREREVVVNERLMRVDNDPEGLLSERMYREAFRVHPYGVPTIGWMEDIRRISLADCMRFYRTHYAPNNATIVVVGDVATTSVLAGIEARYGHLQAQEVPAEHTPREPAQADERRLTLSLPLSSPRLVKAWKAPPSGTAEHAALEVLCEIIVGGDSSRLQRTLVEELELASDVSGWVSSWAHPGLFELSITLRPGLGPDDVARIEAIIDTSLEALLTSDTLTLASGTAEFNKAKNGLEASFYRGLADVGARARALGHSRVTVGDWRDLWSEAARLAAVSPADVQRALAATLVGHPATVAVALPSGEPPPDDDPADESEGGEASDSDEGDEDASDDDGTRHV